MAPDAKSTTRVYRGLGADERRAERRARLLASGLELLGSRGWQATTVTAVCEHARLTPRYFYESFADRDELLVAIFDAIIEEVAEAVLRALPSAPADMGEVLRAHIEAWVTVARDDRRKARVAFVEALGSEALMRRRLDATRQLAGLLTEQARAVYGVPPRGAASLDVAGLVAAGGLIETMIERVEGELERDSEQLVAQFTEVCAASFEAAARGHGRSVRRR
jgi:AcrR family transcriptional regulator